MIRSSPSVKPSFGQDSIVRVMNSTDAGSADEFVLRGFRLTRNVPPRSPTKNQGSIGFHANNGIKMDVDVAISGCEYGVNQ